MPRSIENTYEKHPLVCWTDVCIADIQRLQDCKASGLVTRVWMVLKTYAWNKRTCFPSIKSIAERMGYDLTQNYKQTIGRALRWLDTNGFINRKSRTSKERFTLLQSLRPNEKKSERECLPESEPESSRKNTQGKNTQTPLLSPQGEKATRKQRVRSQRRRKRLRKQDLRHIAEVQQRNEEVKAQHNQAIEEYKQAKERTAEVLQGLLEEHECNDAPNTTKSAERAYFVGSILHFYGWVEKLPARPETLQRASQMALIDTELTWSLRLNIFELWEHVRRQG
jgi:hypothetical protein